MKDKLERALRKAAQNMRLEAEKTRAQKDRVEERKAIQNLDKAFEVVTARRRGGGKDLWSYERALLQRQAKARGLLSQGEDGIWRYESGKVDKHDRPAERLVKGKVRGKRKYFGPSI